tara:strand:- start:192 stop:437 length:246 start_codon:yes stop_codon:yes gene_type:complete
MIIGLLYIVISLSEPAKPPLVYFTDSFDDMSKCQKKIDSLKKMINAKEVYDEENNRMLVIENREVYQKSMIYWVCKNKKKL